MSQVHLDYFRAESDMATTASYQASFEGFERRGLDASTAERLMRRAVGLALEARDACWIDIALAPDTRRRPLVAASVVPHGAMQAMTWARAGALLIGGCCRTTPADIGVLLRRWEGR